MTKFIDSLSDTTTYADFKYVMQDTGTYAFGARYTYGELMSADPAPFKFKAIIEHYIYKDTLPETSIESHLYYLTPDMFSARTYCELGAKVKIGIDEPAPSLFKKKKTKIVRKERLIKVEDFMDMDTATKKRKNVAVIELVISKLALMSFSV